MKMKNSIKQNEVVENKLELFLKTSEEFEFKKLINDRPLFDTYEIEKKFDGRKGRITILKIERKNRRGTFRILTKKDHEDLLENFNNPKRILENGFKTYGINLTINKLLVWLNDKGNDLLWFPENLAA